MNHFIINYPPEKTDALINRLLALGFTQKRLADECGVPQATLSRLLNKTAQPTATNYHKLVVFAATKLGDK